MKNFLIVVLALLSLNSLAKDKIPSKAEFDALMLNAVRQMNTQLGGMKIDNYTILKFVVYDLNPPLLTYVYSSTELIVLKQDKLNQAQIDAMRKYNISKTCATQMMPLMEPYNFKIAHRFEDGKSGKVIYKLTVSHHDC